MNTIAITGRLTHEPEVKQTTGGIAVCSFRVAVKRPHVKDTTDFFQVKAWRQSAEYVGSWCHKGDTMAVVGALTTEEYTNRDGVKVTNVVISADNVEKLSGGNAQPQVQRTRQQAPAPIPADDFEEILSDERVLF